MARSLTIGMYTEGSNLFGLHDGQISNPDRVHNGGWYNFLGEKLGWGDLSDAQIFRISKEIDERELFVVLGEHDSFWNFVIEPSIVGDTALVNHALEYRPSIEYVWSKCRLIIKKDDVMVLYDRGFGIPKHPYSSLIPNHRWVPRNEAKKVMEQYVGMYFEDLAFVAKMFAAFK